MDPSTFIEMVNLIGFPIAACIALFWMNREQSKYFRQLLKEFQDTINSNTNAINHLINKIDKR
jgi:uncharacterized membrane protein